MFYVGHQGDSQMFYISHQDDSQMFYISLQDGTGKSAKEETAAFLLNAVEIGTNARTRFIEECVEDLDLRDLSSDRK